MPCRFDDTELPGLQPTIGFIDLNSTTPKTLASLIYTKLRGNTSFNFRPFYAKHAEGDYHGAITYLEALFNRHYTAASAKKRIWLAYNLACSYSRLAGISKDAAAGQKAIDFLEIWLENIIQNGARFYADSVEQMNHDDDLRYLRTQYAQRLENRVKQFQKSWVVSRKPSGRNLSTGCFAATTLISTPDGSRRIEMLRPGDPLLSYDLQGGQLVATRVSRVATHMVSGLYDINAMSTTADQPVYVVNREFIPARNVRPNDQLLSAAGQSERCVHVAFRYHEPVQVYDVETDHSTHNYFAGGYLVHNKINLGLFLR